MQARFYLPSEDYRVPPPHMCIPQPISSGSLSTLDTGQRSTATTKLCNRFDCSIFVPSQVPIFIAGESLGGALSILLGLSLYETNVSCWAWLH